MASGVLVGRGYVSIRPEFEGDWTRSINQRAGRAGEDAGGAFAGAFAGALGKLAKTAAIPVAAVGASVGAALASSFAAAGAGAGAFSAAVRPQLNKVTEASELYTKAQDAAAEGGKKAKKAQEEYRRSLAKMPPATRTTALAFIGLKNDVDKWSDSLAGTTMPLFTRGINILRDALPKLTPLVKSAAGAFSGFLDDLGKGQSGEVFRTFADNLKSLSGPSLTSFLNMARNMATGFVGILNAFAPMSRGVTSGLEGLTQRFAAFGAGLAGSSGFQKFMDYVRQNAPLVLSTIGNIASTVGRLVVALAPLGGVTLKVISIFAELVSLIPTPVLEALVNVLAVGVVAMKLFALYTGIVATATRAWAAAQVIWNAVMNANPILRIVTVVIALGAALVLAYQKVGWFRKAVDAAWSGIKTAGLFLWNSVLKPMFAGFMVGLRAIGTAASWLWSVLGPVFRFIWTAAKVLLTIVVVAVIFPIIVAFKALAAAARWLWTNAIGPAFRAIRAVITAWWTVTKAVFGAAIRFVRGVLGAAFRWFYNAVIKPVWARICTATTILWIGLKLIFSRIMGFIRRTLGPVFRWLYNNAIRPAWNGIKSVITSVWNKAIRPAFNAVKKGVSAVGKAFESAKNWIGRQWTKLSAIAKKPIKFIIATVYNQGIVPVWNKVASAFGAPKLNKQSLKGWARGGVIPGYQRAKRDDVMTPMRSGEGVLVPEVVRGLGASAIHKLNAAGNNGGVGAVKRLAGPGFSTGGVVGAARSRGYAKGGIVDKGWGWIKNAASSAWDKVKQGAKWLKDTIKGSAQAGLEKIVRPLIGQISGSSSMYKSMVTKMPKRMLSKIFDWSGEADKKLAAAGVIVGGKGFKAGQRWARTQHGKRYQWGGNGNPSWDCSGFMSAIESVIRGQKPHRRWATGAFGRSGPPGWRRNARSPFQIGITNAGVGHTAGTINGHNVESRGGDGVIYGARARSYRSGLFTSRWGFTGAKYDAGGWLQPGVTTAVNATGQPEAILTSGQWRTMQAAAAGGDGASAPSVLEGDLYLDSGEFLGQVRGVVRSENQRLTGRFRAGR